MLEQVGLHNQNKYFYLKCTKTKVFKFKYAQYLWDIIVTQTWKYG